MGLDKGIEHGKEHRKPYYRSAQKVDKQCRNHGSCNWCLDDREYKNMKREEKMRLRMREYLEEEYGVREYEDEDEEMSRKMENRRMGHKITGYKTTEEDEIQV